MSEKRRDNKGRILRNGECQRKDSWKLENTDPLPKGKRKCKSLRYKEREVQKDFDDGIIPYGGQLTVLESAKKYILQKTGVRAFTRAGYKTVINILEKDDFSTKRIDKVKLSDAKGRLEMPINQGNTVNTRSYRYMIKILFVCHGSILKSPGKARKINGFATEKRRLLHHNYTI